MQPPTARGYKIVCRKPFTAIPASGCNDPTLLRTGLSRRSGFNDGRSVRPGGGGFTVKSVRFTSTLLPVLCLGLLLAAGAAFAQTASQRTMATGGAAAQAKYRSSFAVYDVQTKTTKTIFRAAGEWHAPNFTPDGKYIISDMGGDLYRIPVYGDKTGKPEKLAVSVEMMATNDHAISYDGKKIAITGLVGPLPKVVRSAADIRNPLFLMNIDGSDAHEVHLGWLHGWSPDDKYVVYTQYHVDNFDLYRIDADGSGETQLTGNKGQDDGPEYSGDGKWIYFCSDRSGKWDAWRMPAEGAGPDDKLAEKMTSSKDAQDWFPHVSADGKWLYTISYPIDHPDHQYIGSGMKIRLLSLTGGAGAEFKTVATFYGGQGSGNTSGWAPDSKRFAWVVYEKVPAQPAK